MSQTAKKRDFNQWSTVIYKPTFWWRLKALFVAPEITFCCGEDEYIVSGLKGADYLAMGGVPDFIRKKAEGKS